MRLATLALVLATAGCPGNGGPPGTDAGDDGGGNDAGGDAGGGADAGGDPPDAPVSGACGGGRILFERQVAFDDHDIYVVDAESGVETPLLVGDTDDREPSWSPDFTRILFRRDYEYYVANADGSGPVRITDGSSTTFKKHGVWSPQGDRVAFVRESDLGDFGPDIFVVNADGTNPVRLTNTSRAWSPTWSPDGSRIAYRAFLGRRVIATMNDDGSDPQALADLMDFVQGDPPPRWSPDGARIAFMDRDAACGIRVWLVDADGTDKRRIDDDCDPSWPGGLDSEPAWAPDGSRLVFSRSWRDDNVGLWSVASDGLDPQRISPALVADTTRSPGGQCLAFIFTGDSHYNVNRMPANGGPLVELTHTESPLNNWHPSWGR